jgi:hypothetical protein
MFISRTDEIGFICVRCCGHTAEFLVEIVYMQESPWGYGYFCVLDLDWIWIGFGLDRQYSRTLE